MNSQVAIQDILPNPFRRIEHYRINEAKIAALQESFRATGMWPIIIGRAASGGKVEIAYGHHRIEAARRTYGLTGKVKIIHQDLSDEQMLKMMANENLEDYGAEFIVTMETVHAAVEAYAAGRITLPEPAYQDKGLEIRFAPSFARHRGSRPPGKRPYTSRSVASFLGWVSPARQKKTTVALNAL